MCIYYLWREVHFQRANKTTRRLGLVIVEERARPRDLQIYPLAVRLVGQDDDEAIVGTPVLTN